ncbi:hypothetical protein RHSIM_Rhsim02G0102400 [Rhododendron simsii]|uniref:FAT domain-containing protein n=1 Tax=Rhododendron simsii TaxID=118357 RepID=A0A834H9U5_RHOSS|nr:hypothetical protein RHSIM_Rhsim02G0102400 [Rhododendron simsii]
MNPFESLPIAVVANYGLVLHTETSTITHEFVRTIHSIQKSSSSNIKVHGLYGSASVGFSVYSSQGIFEESKFVIRKSHLFARSDILHEFKFLCAGAGVQNSARYWLGRLEEAKLLRAQGQLGMAINLAKYISQNHLSSEVISDVYSLVGKWLVESRSSNSRTILEKYLKHVVMFAEDCNHTDKKSITRQSQTHFHLAHYADALYMCYEERLNSNEWQAAMRLRNIRVWYMLKNLQTKELEAPIRRLKSSLKLAMDKEEDERFQGDKDYFLSVALEGYKRCLVIGDKYDVRVVFRLFSLWFTLSSRQIVVNGMLNTIEELFAYRLDVLERWLLLLSLICRFQSYKFIPLVYQIASRMGSRDGHGPHSFQFSLASLVKKMVIDHPYHTIFILICLHDLLALANGDRVKDKQHSRNSFVVDMDKMHAAENLLQELSSYHGAMLLDRVLAELLTRSYQQDTNRKVNLPREICSV